MIACKTLYPVVSGRLLLILGLAVLTTDGLGQESQQKGTVDAPEILAVLNGATNVTVDQPEHALSPGSVVSVYGKNFASHLSSPSPVPLSSEHIPLETAIADTTITFDGVPARFFVITRSQDFPEEQRPGFDQANVQVPWEVMAAPQKSTTRVVVTSNGVSSEPFDVDMAQASPGIFTFLAGPGPAIVQNLDGSFAQPENFLNGAVTSRPATPGDVIIVWVNGLGPLMGTVGSGDVPGLDDEGNPILLFPQKEVRVFVGGKLAQSVAVLHPTLVALFQINATVPEDVEQGDEVPILIEVDCGDGVVLRSREDVTIAVKKVPLPSLTSITVSQAQVQGGSSITGTVTLDGPAAAGGALVTLQSNNVAASMPSNVTVVQNQTSANFMVQTQTVASTQVVTLTATYTGNSVTTQLTVTAPPPASSGPLVISQLYGGGGNAGATLTNDFIEIFNRGTTAVSIQGWTVQYASASGSQWSATTLTGTIPPGRYYLVQEGMGQSGGTQPLPTPDALGGIGLSASSGKVALVSNTTLLSGATPSSGNIVDFVGYGSANHAEGAAADGLSNTTGLIRAGGGCTDTDNNAADFSKVNPAPRNSSSPTHPCS